MPICLKHIFFGKFFTFFAHLNIGVFLLLICKSYLNILDTSPLGDSILSMEITQNIDEETCLKVFHINVIYNCDKIGNKLQSNKKETIHFYMIRRNIFTVI